MITKQVDNAVPYLDPYVLEKDRGTPWLDCRDNYEWYITYGHIFKPKNILEVGVRFGYSVLSLLFGSGGATKMVSLYDNEQEEYGCLDIAAKLIRQAFPDVLIYLHNIDTGTLERPPEVSKFELIHIDGNHRPFAVLKDIRIFWEMVSPGGVMILDDMNSISGEKSSQLFFHVLPYVYDMKDVSQFSIINNYSRNLLLYKKG